jgi:hypothetical protein
MLSLPDPRTGSGYGSTGKSASGLGTQYQRNKGFPYREPDIDMEDEDFCDSDKEDGCISVDDETHQQIQNKTLGTHQTSDPHKRRDYGSFSGHSVKFNLYQGHKEPGPLLTSEVGVATNSVSPIPGLYKGRQASGATGGASASGLTTGPASKGGVTSKRKFSRAQPLARDEKMPRKFNLLDIIFGGDENIETLYYDNIEDEEGQVEEEI